jgi:N-acetylmuramoyl-L-alanine amidase
MLCTVSQLMLSSSAMAEKCVKTDFVVAIDIGHSKARPGAISARGVEEFLFNQHLSRSLVQTLISHGFTQSFLINENGEDLSLTARTKIASEKKARLLLSIHHDSVQPRYLSTWEYDGKQLPHCELFQGYSLVYSPKNETGRMSLRFTQALGAELRKRGFVPALHHAEKIKGENHTLVDRDKGIYQYDNLGILNTAKMPAILIECGVIVNQYEELSLNNELYQQAFVTSIREAIERTCERWN